MHRALFIFFLLCGEVSSQGQVAHIPYNEDFDRVVVPALPAGWSTSTERLGSGDFSTTASTPFAGPNAAISTNATIAQFLSTPLLDFTSTRAGSLRFFERRSSTHNSGLVIDASIDGGLNYPYRIGDTLNNPGTSVYVERALKLPAILDHQPLARLRWRVIGDGTGTSGTLRIDAVSITGIPQTDAAVMAVASVPPSPVEADPVTIHAVVKNMGYAPLSRVPVEFFEISAAGTMTRCDPDTIAAPIAPGDSAEAVCTLEGLPAGFQDVFVRCAAAGDQVGDNDTMRLAIDCGVPRSAMVINEIMYDPRDGGAEYVELLNRSVAPVNIAGWKLSDVVDTARGPNGHTLAREEVLIGAGEYVVIASDSSVTSAFASLSAGPAYLVVRRSGLSLNNAGDRIILYDRPMHTVDSVAYFPSWHNANVDDVKGKSLERISAEISSNDRRNWSTCADLSGGTPGRRNSLVIDSHPPPGSLTCAPNPFSPDGDGVEDDVLIRYDAPVTAVIVRARIFDSIGRLVRVLADGEPSGAHGELIWNGMNDKGERVRMGIYILLVELSDGTSVYALKGIVVVAAKL